MAKVEDRRDFSSYHGLEIPLILIKHPRITQKALLELASIDASETLQAIAELATAPPSVLTKLADLQERGVNYYIYFWENLVRNSNTPPEALEKLFLRLRNNQHPQASGCLSDIASHPNLPVHLLEELATDRSYYLRAKVGRNPSTPVHILPKLADAPELNVRCAVAENRSTPVDILMGYAAISDPFVWSELAIGLSMNVQAPITILETLADNERYWIRANVAKNIKTPISILERLALDPDNSVRQGLTKNPQTPAIILDLLANALEERTCWNIAIHKNTSIETLLKLAEAQDDRVRKPLIDRTNLPKVVIEKLIEATLDQIQRKGKDNWNSTILLYVAGHPNTPSPMLEKLAFNLFDEICAKLNMHFYELQEAVASNVNTSISLLEKLAKDSNGIVQKAAKKTLKAKPDISQQYNRIPLPLVPEWNDEMPFW